MLPDMENEKQTFAYITKNFRSRGIIKVKGYVLSYPDNNIHWFSTTGADYRIGLHAFLTEQEAFDEVQRLVKKEIEETERKLARLQNMQKNGVKVVEE